jgi:phage tail P2-like protein
MLPTASDHLLPPNATADERTVAALTDRITAIPSPIEAMHRPAETPARFLPWLGWEWSIDIWDDAWSEEKKRRVIARSFDLHRLKGTPQGIRDHVALTDGDIVQFVRPPQGAFAGRDLTKDELDAWLRTMPQIRVYLAREVGEAGAAAFIEQDFYDDAFALFDAGRALYGRAARLWDRGVETPLVMTELTTEREARLGLRIERVMIPGEAAADTAFADASFADDGFVDATVLEPRFVTYRQEVAYQHVTSSLAMHAIAPGLDPIDVRSERISARGTGDELSFCDDAYCDDGFAGTDGAAWMLYDRIVLHDPARAAPMIDGWSFYDDARLGLPGFTAMALIDLQQQAEPRAGFTDDGFCDDGFAIAEDDTRRMRAREAVNVSKALRDRVLVTHKMRRPLTFADGIPLDGSFRFGGTTSFRL